MSFGDLDEQSIMTTETQLEKLNLHKLEVNSALLTGTYITPLHRKLATKALTLKSLDIVFEYSSRPKINSEFKPLIGHSFALGMMNITNRNFGGNTPRDKWERDYHFAVFLPIVIWFSQKEVIQITLETRPKKLSSINMAREIQQQRTKITPAPRQHHSHLKTV